MEKKQTLLLTVIAVATLLVAVVGATFAYFTAQGGGGANSQVNVVTSTTATSNFTVDSTLSINANQSNFNETSGHAVSNTVIGTTTFTSSNAAQGNDLKYCYTVTLDVDKNTFEYKDASNNPELILTMTKDGSNITATQGIVSVAGEVGDITAGTTLSYVTVLGENTKPKGDNILGFDVTAIAPGLYRVGGIHELDTKTAGATVSNTWTTKITFVNLDDDQEWNTNKSFTGYLLFAQADCS